MITFVAFCVLALITVGLFVVTLFVKARADKVLIRGWGIGAAALTLIVLFFASATTVDTKNVGVTTTFGHPDGYLSNGFHFVWPWQDVTELNDAVQTDTYASDGGDSGKQQGGVAGTCVHVRIERQATACVNVSIRWQIRQNGVDYLFRNYRDNAAITDNLVLRDLQQALNEQFVTYDPLAVDANGQNTNRTLAWYSANVQRKVRADINRWIVVSSVIVPIINYDADTQSKVHQLLAQIALTRVAQQSEQTALAQAKANRALAASVANDPNVLTDKCLNILKEAVDKGQALPAGFSCFAGSSATVAVRAK